MLSLALLLLIPTIWLSACLHDGFNSTFCSPFDNTTDITAVMSNAFLLLPHSLLWSRTADGRAVAILNAMKSQPSRLFSSTKRVPREEDMSPRFTYRLAAASAPKRAPPRKPQAGQDFWSYTTVERGAPSVRSRLVSTKRASGEDAFFAAAVGGDAHHVAFGVADGVGGWQDQGVDPSVFSHGLVHSMALTAVSHHAGNPHDPPLRPQPLLQTAYDAVLDDPQIVAGGCTASLGIADARGHLECANLGDSGFLIVGPSRIAFRSPIQTHTFNTPYQLSKIPRRMRQQHSIFGGAQHLSESPAQADVSQHRLRHGDLVVFATDGVWDNLSAQDTLAILTRVMEEQGHWYRARNAPGAERLLNESLIRAIPDHPASKTPAAAALNISDEEQDVECEVDDSESGMKGDREESLRGQTQLPDYLPARLATAVMREAKLAGLDRRRDGPFAREVRQQFPQDGWSGGKPDDIAVVVCVAVEEGEDGKGKARESKL